MSTNLFSLVKKEINAFSLVIVSISGIEEWSLTFNNVWMPVQLYEGFLDTINGNN